MWRVSVSRDWDVLGPFPIQAREQHYLSPSFPLNLSEPVDFDAQWSSSYADGGTVGWSTARTDETGTLEVSFPDIRWSSLRATEGWAALQHHTVLHTRVTVFPPTSAAARASGLEVPENIRVSLLQGSFFALIPSSPDALRDFVPEWHAGNIYAMSRSPAATVALPESPAATHPTTYDLYVSGDYEIRLFGVPRDGSETPKLSITISATFEWPLFLPMHYATRESSHDVTCDFVDGWAFGDSIGIGMRSISGWWTAKDVTLLNSADVSRCDATSIAPVLVGETRIAPTQTRIIPVRLIQTERFTKSELRLVLHLSLDSGGRGEFLIVIPIRQHPQWSSTTFPPTGIKASYFFASMMPTAFLVTPPEEPNVGEPRPPVLALHGAGVDIFELPFWIQALPRQGRSWIIVPTGRTPWGLDWHGPSAQDAWSSVEALHIILKNRESWHPWAIAENTRVLVVGHSNGGQGTWYLASRYPDKVIAAIPAAGYIKSQAYVPLIESRSAHYIDPALRAVLESSLTPDDNDLFLSNMADMPVLAIHGGDDDNVPVWHTREAVSVVRTWNPRANITYKEDSGEPHWYPTVFKNEQVEEFLRANLERESGHTAVSNYLIDRSFTLTVSIPSESGSLHGWMIHSLSVPGRLARINVRMKDGTLEAHTSNVKTFSMPLPLSPLPVKFIIDGQALSTDSFDAHAEADVLFFSNKNSTWSVSPTLSESITTAEVIPGRMSSILTSSASLIIVIPDKSPSHWLSAALRLAHNLNVYHKLDVEIVGDTEAVRDLQDGWSKPGNIVILDDGQGGFFQALLDVRRTPIEITHQTLRLNGRNLNSPSTSALFLHPHPSETTSQTLFMFAPGRAELERTLRLFPIRTGVAVPDWIVLGDTDVTGAAGVVGAGVWGNDWSWNEAMSSF
ncbi:hypothetical protein OBBRIDRAFT_720837 [Obba rivulosa]|uniref:Peptidase S9 prolyl oligopeptidase catalytic domain-containing protein n=1 Tax=Obba rivulosa TaxID=1052685 RepID=A0A8E2DT93_9APHY|nr:hypothetical protein OBBRIDRAFT_720837 [Obba rivulosa]